MVGGTSQWRASTPSPPSPTTPARRSPRRPTRTCSTNKLVSQNLRVVVPNDANGQMHPTLYPLQVGYRKRGQSGIEVSDWWPHVGDVHRRHRRRPLDVDDRQQPRRPAPVPHRPARPRRRLPHHRLVGPLRPGLAERQPAAVRRPGHPDRRLLRRDRTATAPTTSAPSTPASASNVDPTNPLPFASPGTERLPRGAGRRVRAARPAQPPSRPPSTPTTPPCGRGSSRYELAFRMQTAVPEVLELDEEDEPTRRLYGLDQDATRTFGQQCLAARRLVERGVRFVQVFHGSNGGAGAWDAHGGLKAGHSALCEQVDQPIAGLLRDLKRRGLLDETLVVWGTEFGRTPGAQGADGRDHHPYGFSRLAGRRRHQGRRRPRRHRRAGLPRRRRPPLRHRPARHRPAPARPRPAPAGGAGPQAPGDRLRRADPGDHRVATLGVSPNQEMNARHLPSPPPRPELRDGASLPRTRRGLTGSTGCKTTDQTIRPVA